MNFEIEKPSFFLLYNSLNYSSIYDEDKNLFIFSDCVNIKNNNSDNEIDTTLYKTKINENKEKKIFFKKFKTEKNIKQPRFDYLIKDTKKMINNQLIKDLNLITKKIGKNYKFFKMNTKFTSNTNYKNNNIWFNYKIRDLLYEFLDKKDILKSLNNLKNQNRYINIIKEIDDIFDKTYEEYILNNYYKLNDNYVVNIKSKYLDNIYNNCDDLKDLIKKIKNTKPYDVNK